MLSFKFLRLFMIASNKMFSRLLLTLYCFLLVACTSSENEKAGRGLLRTDFSLPDGFTIENAVDSGLISYPMFASFDSSGRLFVCESDGRSPGTEEMLNTPTHSIVMLEDRNEDGIFDKRTIFADSLTYPKGAVFYMGSLYVASAPDLLRLTDTDGDGRADKKEVLLSGWIFHHNGALMGGPFPGPDGWLYITDARRGFDITSREGEKMKGSSTRIWRCRPDGSGLESLCSGGYDNAIEMAFMPSGETIGTMTYFTEPRGGERDAVMHWVEGGVYPKPYPVIEQDKLVLTGELMPVMTKMARVAPSGIMRYSSRTFGPDYKNNFFSAEFNTGRILRHRITASGATYTSSEETFLASSSTDIHFTDVLEDADGSLLIVNTGGWFISGCPLSRVAKPEVKGGIYRIRKSGVETPEDPRGKKTDLRVLTDQKLKEKLKEENAVMHERIFGEFIRRGSSSVSALADLLQSENEDLRIKSVFALSATGDKVSMDHVVTALGDSSNAVQTAAARVLGLVRYKESVNKLTGLLGEKSLQVRRQAATALGRIGDPKAVPALIRILSAVNDRVSEHAVLFALIQLKQTAPLREALNHSSLNVRNGALIALDQIGGQALAEADLYPFLNSTDSLSLQTGLWVASHHKDWTAASLVFVKHFFEDEKVPYRNYDQVRKLITGFSTHAGLRRLLSSYLSDAAIDSTRKMLVLDIMADPAIRDFPPEWTEKLKYILNSGNEVMKNRVLGIAGSRKLSALKSSLNAIVLNQRNPPEFRMTALLARLSTDPVLTSPEFELVNEYLKKNHPATHRSMAVRLLSQAKPGNDQLIRLANEQVTDSDSWLLPGLLSAYKGNRDKQVGMAVVNALSVSKDRVDHFSETSWIQLLSSYPPEVQRAGEPVLAIIRQKNEQRFSQLTSVDSSLVRGDVSKGSQLFFGKATCGSCHAVAGRGALFGPDLTNIGQIRSRHDILEAILYPDVSFAREHETFDIKTGTSTHTGIIKMQHAGYIVLQTGPGQEIRINKEEIQNISQQNRSMMPPGLDKLLSGQELSDLMAYLESLPDGMGGRRSSH